MRKFLKFSAYLHVGIKIIVDDANRGNNKSLLKATFVLRPLRKVRIPREKPNKNLMIISATNDEL